MTGPYPSGIDPAHVQAICVAATASHSGDGEVLVAAGRDSVTASLPGRAAARWAAAALSLAGYQVDPAGGRRLVVRGWSAAGLDQRLAAMRTVLHQLSCAPRLTAIAALEQCRPLPADALPDRAAQRQLLERAARQLRDWIAVTSGIHAPLDLLAEPAATGIALRLRTTRRLEESIADLTSRQLQVAEHALALYPALRAEMSHDRASATAIRQAITAWHLPPSPIAQDSTTLLAATTPPGRNSPAGRPARRR